MLYTFLEQLQAELDGLLPKDFAPEEGQNNLFGDIAPPEKKVGECPEDLLRLMVLVHKKYREANRMIEEHERLHHTGEATAGAEEETSADCTKFRREMKIRERQYETLSALFWMNLREELGLTQECILLRENGTVVTAPRDEREELTTSFLVLGGGMMFGPLGIMPMGPPFDFGRRHQ